jgi:hypothetical protein
VGCCPRFERQGLAQNPEVVLGSKAYATKQKLKNEDAVVAAVLAAAGLKVQCLRLLKAEYVDDD